MESSTDTTGRKMYEQINRIHKRQVARMLDHLERTGQLTPSLATDIKRSFGFVFEDIKTAIKQGQCKEDEDEGLPVQMDD
jgi:hypothetical protein